MNSFASKQNANGVTIDVLIQPKSSRDEITGVHGDRLKIKLTAPPVDGKANAALIAFLATTLGISKSAISIVRGETSRQKRIRITGMTAEQVKLRITHL